jgi:rfaE bifunctional protein kinase chain/domain
MAKNIIVIGDVMLDKYDYCSNAENPESSAPAWTVERTEYKPGGAGNVAANLTSLGAEFELISVVGDDYPAKVLQGVLKDFKVPCNFIFDSERQTIVKERIVSSTDGRYHCRINRDKKKYIDENHVREIIDRVQNAELILVSDYRKGMISSRLMDELRAQNVPIIVDAKPEHADFYRNVFLVKPNYKEAVDMTGIKDAVKAGEALMNRLNSNVLLTRGSEGINYFGLKGERYYFPAEERKVVDVTGAGDTAIATFSHFLMKGKKLEECIQLANRAAGIAVSYPGCYQVTEKEIFDFPEKK